MGKKNNGEHISKSKFGSNEYLALIFCVIIGIALIAVVVFTDNSSDNKGNESTGASYEVIDLMSEETEESKDESMEDEVSEPEEEYEIVSVNNESVHQGNLILVNKQHFYVFNNEAEMLSVLENKCDKYKIGTGEEKLAGVTIDAANEFLGDFFDLSGKKNVTMTNGYISEEEQQAKYEKYIKSVSPEEAQKWGVKAGASDHHTGLSFNLILYPAGGIIGEGDYAWLTENAHRYGFVIRYPEEKSEITSVKDNNHFRYVGVPHAEYMYNNNLCLEEYMDKLSNTSYNNKLTFQSGNKEYSVYYFPADLSSDSTEIKIPQGSKYTISGNNINGFVVLLESDKI